MDQNVSTALKRYHSFAVLFKDIYDGFGFEDKAEITARQIRLKEVFADGNNHPRQMINRTKNDKRSIRPSEFFAIAEAIPLGEISKDVVISDVGLSVQEQFFYLAIQKLIRQGAMLTNDAPEHELFLSEAVQKGLLSPSQRDKVTEALDVCEKHHKGNSSGYVIPPTWVRRVGYPVDIATRNEKDGVIL